MKLRMLPNLLVIGAQKCGTTSLHRYLDAHPEIAMSDPKELDFFVEHEDRPHYVANGNWHRGVDWYASQFPDDAPVRGEASPNYTAYPNVQRIPERAAEIVPGAALIYMVRDPIERIVSHYLHRVGASPERRSLKETLGDIERGSGMVFVDRSRYFMQIERWLEYSLASDCWCSPRRTSRPTLRTPSGACSASSPSTTRSSPTGSLARTSPRAPAPARGPAARRRRAPARLHRATVRVLVAVGGRRADAIG